MERTVYSRFQPGLSATVFGEPDEAGGVPAYIHENDKHAAAVIKLDEWSDIETVPMLPTIPLEGFLIIHGDDPAIAEATFVETEKQVKQWMRAQQMFGYTAVRVPRVMIPSS